MPHIHGFPLLGWELARAEITSLPAFGRVQSAIRAVCRNRICDGITATGVNDSQDLLHNSHWLETLRRNNQSQTRCCRDAKPCITATMHGSELQDHLIVRKGGRP